MFKIATSVPKTLKFEAAGQTIEVAFDFRWLGTAARLAAIAEHDQAIDALGKGGEPDAAGQAHLASEYNRIHAELVTALASGWNVAVENGDEPAPFDAPTVAAFLDLFPGVFGLILTASAEATSIKAIEGN